MLEKVTLTTLPVALKSVLMRSPLVELATVGFVNLKASDSEMATMYWWTHKMFEIL